MNHFQCFLNINILKLNINIYINYIMEILFTEIQPTHEFTGNINFTASQISGLSKTNVGLNLVNNTADLDKPISNLVQTALDNSSSTLTQALTLKADLNSPNFTGTITGITKSMVSLGNV